VLTDANQIDRAIVAVKQRSPRENGYAPDYC
jgi:hypothetical protein